MRTFIIQFVYVFSSTKFEHRIQSILVLEGAVYFDVRRRIAQQNRDLHKKFE